MSALRPARAEDIPRLQEIERAAAQMFRPLGLLTLDALSDVVSDAEHRAAIEARLSVVEESETGSPLGYAMGQMEGADSYLHQIDVHPDHQRRGAGARLLNAFCAAAAARGARAIILSTFRDVPWNAPFYAKHGFGEIPRARYADWMRAIEADQAKMLDIGKRLFMRRPL